MAETLRLAIRTLLERLTFRTSKERSTGDIINWIPIQQLSEFHVGICEGGSWCIEAKDGLIILEKEGAFGYLISMLESRKEEIFEGLSSFSEEHMLTTNIASEFPYNRIVKAGFVQGADYWAQLAFNWYDQFSDSEKVMYEDIFYEVVSSKWASQRTKQKARRELNRFKR